MADKVVSLSVKINTETGQLDVLGAKFTGVAEKAKKAQGSFSGLAGEAGNLVKSFLPFATGAGILAFFASAVKGAEEENEALRRLQNGLKQAGISWNEHEKAVLSWAAAIQSATRFSDTQALTTLDRLVRVTGNLTQAQQAAQLAMGLSVASGKQLAETEGVLVNLLNGNQRALLEINKEFGAFTGGARNAQEALDILQTKLGGAAFQEDSLTKSTASLKNAFGEFQETVGRALIPALTSVAELGTSVIGMFDSLGIVIANFGAKAMAFAEAIATATFQAAKMNFSGVSQAFEQMSIKMAGIEEASVQMVAEKEALKTAAVSMNADERVRLHAKASQSDLEEKRKENEMVVQLEMELDQRIAALGEDTLSKKKAMLATEMAARQNKIKTEIKDETARAKLLDKLHLEEAKRSAELTKAEVKFKTDAAFKIASDSINALQILNSMQDGHTKQETRRAKILLAIQQALAIAALWRAEASKGVVGIALASAGTAVLVAQYAAQAKALDQAHSAAAQGNSQIQVSTDLPGGGRLNENLPGSGVDAGAPSMGGGSFGGGGGGGGGGAGTTVINVGGVVLNLHVDHLDLSDVEVVGRRLAEYVRSGVAGGINLAVTMRNVGEKNAGLAA